MTHRILLGSNKGAFIMESGDRRDWSIRGPYCDAWPINHVIACETEGALLAGGGNGWLGPGVWRSDDMGETWTLSQEGLVFGPEERPNSVWSLAALADGGILAGTEPAALFRSDDGGATWRHLEGLQRHPTRPDWPPGGAGLTLHHIVADPDDPARFWVGISSAGVFATEDGGESFTPRNRGIRNDYAEEQDAEAEIGYCVHGIALAAGGAPGGRRLYQQNHCGMYRSDDDGANWESVENGLPSSFGFPVAAHPSDPDTAWLIPLNGDIAGRYMPGGRAAVWRTRDAGRSWSDQRRGLPQEHCYYTVLRQALAVDREGSPGLYFATNSGDVYASLDLGESWSNLARHLPLIHSVELASG